MSIVLIKMSIKQAEKRNVQAVGLLIDWSNAYVYMCLIVTFPERVCEIYNYNHEYSQPAMQPDRVAT